MSGQGRAQTGACRSPPFTSFKQVTQDTFRVSESWKLESVLETQCTPMVVDQFAHRTARLTYSLSKCFKKNTLTLSRTQTLPSPVSKYGRHIVHGWCASAAFCEPQTRWKCEAYTRNTCPAEANGHLRGHQQVHFWSRVP